MFSTDWIGYAAAVLTTASFVPQVAQILKTRDTRAISLPMYGAFTTGIALWLAYGVQLGAWPIIAANVITLSLALAILLLKLRFG
jgi:MtN3 and saliva related transmembrane protein